MTRFVDRDDPVVRASGRLCKDWDWQHRCISWIEAPV
ncbi:hypothetical protein BX265_0996 [Streptomyces sp. TLI_235]|nr:hypothetical protein BX265_0996 [Streptomyces sp. TLI_235]